MILAEDKQRTGYDKRWQLMFMTHEYLKTNYALNLCIADFLRRTPCKYIS